MTEESESTSEETDVMEMYERSEEDEFLEESTEDEFLEDGSAEERSEETEATAATDEPKTPRFEAHLPGEEPKGPERATGVYYVKYAQEGAVTLHDVSTSQIFTLIENPGVETHHIIEATLVAQPPMEVSYLIEELHDHRQIPVERSPEPPTQRVREIATEMEPMQAVALDREGTGEIHVLRVEPENTEQTADELDEDEMTYKNAARYGIERVEVRTDADAGVVSIRYLP